MSDADQRFTLLHDGKPLAVETGRSGLETVARLIVNGKPVAEGKNWIEPIRLNEGDLTVDVRSTWLGQVTGCWLIQDDEARIPFTPPAGSHAARLEELASEHPVLYASRHVVIALVQLGLGFLGIGAIFWAFFGALLPRLNLPDFLPEIEIGLPGWLRTILGIPDRITAVPIGWARSGYDWLSDRVGLPDWSPVTSTLWSWFQDARIWIPVVIAAFVAIEEVQRRKGRNAPTGSPTPTRDEASEANRTALKTDEAAPDGPASDDGDDKANAGHSTAPSPPALKWLEREAKESSAR